MAYVLEMIMRVGSGYGLHTEDKVEVTITSIGDDWVRGEVRITVDNEHETREVNTISSPTMNVGQVQLHLLRTAAEGLEKQLAILKAEISLRDPS